MTEVVLADRGVDEVDEYAGAKIGAGALSILTTLFAAYRIWVFLVDDVGFVASVIWFYGLPVAVIMSVIALLCLRRTRRVVPAVDRTASSGALLGVVTVSCGLLAVLFGMGLTYFW